MMNPHLSTLFFNFLNEVEQENKHIRKINLKTLATNLYWLKVYQHGTIIRIFHILEYVVR